MTRDEILAMVTAQLRCLPEVRNITLHGSLESGHPDRYSDIDLKIDVSGSDNGRFMLELPRALEREMKLSYAAYATRFIPDLYLVTIHVEHTSPFHFVDIECHATPHESNVGKDDIYKIGSNECIILKSAINCLKSVLRGIDATNEIEHVYRFKFQDNGKLPLEKLADTFEYFRKDSAQPVRGIAEECLNLLNEHSVKKG